MTRQGLFGGEIKEIYALSQKVYIIRRMRRSRKDDSEFNTWQKYTTGNDKDITCQRECGDGVLERRYLVALVNDDRLHGAPARS